MKSFSRIMMSAGAASLVAGLACAQNAWVAAADQQESRVSAAQRAERRAEARAQASNDRDNTSTLEVHRNGRRFSIKQKDGKVTSASIDGKSVPPDRIVEDETTIKLLDEDGNVAFETQRMRGGGFAYGLATTEPMHAHTIEVEKRPMIGVTLSDVGEALAGQLGIDPEKSVVISGVTKGMPAEKAGLKKNDIVVKIEGNAGASSEQLSEAIRSRKPGDEISLGVMREGKPVEIKVTIGEGSPLASVWVEGEGAEGMGWLGDEAGARALAERLAVQAREQGVRARELGERYRAMAEEFGDRFRVQVHAGAERVHELLEELHEAWDEVRESVAEEGADKISELLERLQDELDRSGDRLMGVMPRVEFFNEERDGGPRALVVPTPPVAPAAPSAPRAPREFRWQENTAGGQGRQQLEERIQALEQRIDALLKKMDEQSKGGN
ncbi:MAG: PDZ domain-containing protein [Phycisphaerales bacterium]